MLRLSLAERLGGGFACIDGLSDGYLIFAIQHQLPHKATYTSNVNLSMLQLYEFHRLIN